MIARRSCLAVLLVGLVGGCSGALDSAKESVEESRASVDRALEDVGGPRDEQSTTFVRSSDRIWLGSRGFESPHGAPLPVDSFALNEDRALTLQEIGARVTEATGISLVVERFSEDSEERSLASGPVDLTGAPINPLSFQQQPMATVPTEGRMRVDAYRGSLTDFLNLASVTFDYNWTYDSGTIRFFRYETRHFPVLSGPMMSEWRSSVAASSVPQQNSSSRSGTDSGNELNAESETTIENSGIFEVFNEIVRSVEAMVPDAATVVGEPSTGAITVTAPRYALGRVERYLEEKNNDLRRQVAIVVKVVSIIFADDEGYGFQLEGVFNDLSSNTGLTVSGLMPQFASEAGTITAAVLDGSKNFAGSSAFIAAVSKRGRASVQTRAPVTGVNHRPISFQNVNTRTFVASAQTTLTEVGSSTELVPGTVITGFTLNLMPTIYRNGEIFLEYSINFSDPPQIPSFSSGTTTIQTPEINSRQIANSIYLRSGSSLVLAGFEQVTSMLDSRNGFLSFEKSGASRREVIAIIIEPFILGRPADGPAGR